VAAAAWRRAVVSAAAAAAELSCRLFCFVFLLRRRWWRC
jgi:hypothetical protein